MQNLPEFINAIETLLHSWGSETPPEAIWGVNELLDWAEVEFNVKFDLRFDEPFAEDAINPDLVINELRSKL